MKSHELIIKNVSKKDAKDLAAALKGAMVGLSDEQLRAVAGGRMAEKTGTPTSPPITKCCWG